MVGVVISRDSVRKRLGGRTRSSERKSESEMGKRTEIYLSVWMHVSEYEGEREKGELVTKLYIYSSCIGI